MNQTVIKRMISDYILVQAEIALSFGIVGSIWWTKRIYTDKRSC